ncbi:MAG: DUF928 domain-containing protein [Scytonema sp. PMC 1069.18]|nr:DUF928 domain-containing protein [Scytonema sp. PMC 1069.18]MEC4884916.1 DUF928 domain-containing protein [Scytonema sp. PMC 1070.18]
MPPEGSPSRRRGGGGRAPEEGERDLFCGVKPDLTALIPRRGLGLTSRNPKFWFYVPSQGNTSYSAEFLLSDKSDKGNQVYSKTFKLEKTPGIMSISLPNNVKLDSNKIYQWKLSVIVNPKDRNDDCFIFGGVKQVPLTPDVSDKLKSAKTARERIAIYAENGLWHDVLTDLAELRRQNPNDETLKSDWNDLLGHQDVRLEDIASKPIVSCCEFNSQP